MTNMATIATRNDVETLILTPEARRFLTKLAREFESRRRELLQRRQARQRQIDAGVMPDFLPDTANIRESEWKVAPIPHDLLDRRVEITGPPDRKMIINALNSGASVFMADFEDSNSPTWTNNLEGQANLRDAVDGTISFVSPEGKRYELNPPVATCSVSPRMKWAYTAARSVRPCSLRPFWQPSRWMRSSTNCVGTLLD